MIDLPQDHLLIVQRILRGHVKNIEVRAFGSRVNGTAKAFSDLDLVIMTKERMGWQGIEALKYAFSESDLPMIVDVIDWQTLSQKFQQIINQKYEVIQYD